MKSYDKYLQKESEKWNEAYNNPDENYSDPILDELATKMFSKYIKNINNINNGLV